MSFFKLTAPVFLVFLLIGCEKPKPANVKHEMGERVSMGPLSYVVVESSWKNQLGEGFSVRSPQHRFLLLKISVTNTSTAELSVPKLSLQGSNDQMYEELADYTGVPNSLGLLRNIAPAQTIQGNIAFDVPLTSFRLRVPDDGASGYEKYDWIEIPLSIDADSVQAPLPGTGGQ